MKKIYQIIKKAFSAHKWLPWLIVLLICSVTLFAPVFIFALSPIQSSIHVHSYKEEIVTYATCVEDGRKSFSCTCGHHYRDNYTLQELTPTEIYEQTKHCVGEIITYNKNGSELSLGTGFVYSEDGKIITNYHVMKDAYSAKITIQNRTYTIQKVLAYDESIDLIVLKINATLPTIKICYNEHPVGKSVYAFGSSRGLFGTFSQGIITYSNRILENVQYVQHDAAISSGNSGGPLINSYGEIIGINTMYIKDSQNLNFAIRVNEIGNLHFSTPLSISQFYEKVCNPFLKLKNYIIENGTYRPANQWYSLTIGTSYSIDYSYEYTRGMFYNIESNTIDLCLLVDSSYLFTVTINSSLNGYYQWEFNDNSYSMKGYLNASSFGSYTTLSYSSNNFPSYLRTSTKELASSMLRYFLSYMKNDLSSINVTPSDLGFSQY